MHKLYVLLIFIQTALLQSVYTPQQQTIINALDLANNGVKRRLTNLCQDVTATNFERFQTAGDRYLTIADTILDQNSTLGFHSILKRKVRARKLQIENAHEGYLKYLERN
jgi:hypothetical protein